MAMKIIEGIQPYNDIFYKSCFYNSFFPITQWMNKNIYPHIANDLMTYDQENSGALRIEYTPFRDVKDIFKEEGYEINIKIKSENIVHELIESIQSNQPTIVWIDSFYENIRPDLYGVEHWKHSLLVFGYQKNEQRFAIMEHSNRDSLNYKLQWISFESMETAYNEFFNNAIPIDNTPTFHSFSNYFQVKKSNWSELFTHNMFNHLELYKQGIDNLAKYVHFMKEMILHPYMLQEHSNTIYTGINEIINAKQVEFMRFASFDSHIDRMNLVNMLLESWKNVRTIFARYHFSRQKLTDGLFPIISILEDVISMEQSLYVINKDTMK